MRDFCIFFRVIKGGIRRLFHSNYYSSTIKRDTKEPCSK
jgi:hypothetical protein